MLTYTQSHKMTILLYKAMHMYKVCTRVLDFDFTLWLERKLKTVTITRWSVTSLRGPGERNFNAVSHKPKLTGTDWIELNWCARWFMGYGIKISFPRPPQWRHRSPGKVCTYLDGPQQALRDPGFAFNLKLGIWDFKAKSGRESGLKYTGRWEAKNNPLDYGIARNFGSGLRDRKTPLGTLYP